MAAHRLKAAQRHDGEHCRMSGRMLVVFRIEGGKLAVVAPKLLLDKSSPQSAGAVAPAPAAPADASSA